MRHSVLLASGWWILWVAIVNGVKSSARWIMARSDSLPLQFRSTQPHKVDEAIIILWRIQSDSLQRAYAYANTLHNFVCVCVWLLNEGTYFSDTFADWSGITSDSPALISYWLPRWWVDHVDFDLESKSESLMVRDSIFTDIQKQIRLKTEREIWLKISNIYCFCSLCNFSAFLNFLTLMSFQICMTFFIYSARERER